jgi:hypothetical protein
MKNRKADYNIKAFFDEAARHSFAYPGGGRRTEPAALFPRIF